MLGWRTQTVASRRVRFCTFQIRPAPLGWLLAATLLLGYATRHVETAQAQDTTIQEIDSPWEKFLRAEGIPVIRGFAVQDLPKAKVGPWKRYGASGAYVYLDGAGGITTGFILEIAPGKKTTPVRHMFESRVVVLTGEGEAHFWQEGGKKVTAHFKHGTLFPFPLNVWYEIVNTGREPVRHVRRRMGSHGDRFLPRPGLHLQQQPQLHGPL